MRDRPPRPGLLLVLLGSLTAIGPLSIDMYLPAFPDIAAEFGASASQVQLSLTACLVGLAAGQILTGPLSDRYGRRVPVLVGVTAYALASLACAAAPTAPLFAGARLLQGMAGGVGIVVARAVVRDLYAGVEGAKYFSRLTLVFGVAPIAAPSLGAAVLRFTGWHGVFVALAVIAALLAALAAWQLPETLPAHRRSDGGLRDVARTARELVTDRAFAGYALAQAFAFAGLFAYIGGSPFALQDGFGLSGTAYGVLFGVNALGLIALSQANGRLLDRWPPRALLVATLVAGCAAAAAVLGAALAGVLALLAVAMFAFVSTVGMVAPNGTALALDRHGRRAGTAAALLGGVQSAIGAAVAPLVGAFGDPATGVPMAAVILACAAAALLSVLVLAREREPVPA
ncbi:Bcr/CflA family drug resistance efflux transporter [Spirilliplanes yamanashiensis]|uniref:Bcr/CflA family drug resistance efflux transporter n=1 Tax=Spirilliplanes yamanashiensis TaxID=42233 RepID=A0A8J4DKN6_9ACTN|nr:multidrug effflux MFS transporter [Spirilliplanes yamanashiensis]MDP9818625.1 DHA1 family bicyclomycin/chloramphenicol resistance-like MFS transporter [Spirilliplanes yamanashiensis]GIJ05081.1 Bcr/CflA family drug resistance efflux transporter [Spirilliplanes yamanashiensis]